MHSSVFWGAPFQRQLEQAWEVSVKRFVLRFAKDKNGYSEHLPTFTRLVSATPTIVFHRAKDTNNIVETELHHPYSHAKGWDLGFTARWALRWYIDGISIRHGNPPLLLEKPFNALCTVIVEVFKIYRKGVGLQVDYKFFDVYQGHTGNAIDDLIRHSLTLLPRGSDEE